MSRECPVCGGEVAPKSQNPDFPFCSDRCQLLDLGKWLGEGYRIPGPPASDADVAAAVRARHDDDDSGTLH